jgi:hypothetical protein
MSIRRVASSRAFKKAPLFNPVTWFSSSNVMQLNAVRYLRSIRQIEFKAVIRRNPIKCLLCV